MNVRTDALFLLVSKSDEVTTTRRELHGAHSDGRWLIRCVSAALLSFMDKQEYISSRFRIYVQVTGVPFIQQLVVRATHDALRMQSPGSVCRAG